jgi:glucose/arabinose dehydrogenase
MRLLAWLPVGLFACNHPEADDSILPVIALDPVLDGFVSPRDLVADPSGALYVVDQPGVVRALDAPVEPFADLRKLVVPLDDAHDDRGLLGFVFHPKFPHDPRVFAWYSATSGALPPDYDHVDRLASFKVVDGAVDTSTQELLLEIPHPGAGNNGGGLRFGENGLLYVGVGDGGGAGDRGVGHPADGNGQDTAGLLGSVLRIDVDAAFPYAIPADNPFANGGGAPEVYAFGFRDPRDLAFDPHTGELFAADRGEAVLEEVDLVHGGGNYGWNVREGTVCFDVTRPTDPLTSCADTGPDGEPLVAPVLTFPHPGTHILGDGEAGDGVAGVGIVGGAPVRGGPARWEGGYLFGTETRTDGGAEGALFLGIRERDGWRSTLLAVDGRPDGALGERLLRVVAGPDGALYTLTSARRGPDGTSGTVSRLHVVTP